MRSTSLFALLSLLALTNASCSDDACAWEVAVHFDNITALDSNHHCPIDTDHTKTYVFSSEDHVPACQKLSSPGYCTDGLALKYDPVCTVYYYKDTACKKKVATLKFGNVTKSELLKGVGSVMFEGCVYPSTT